MNAYYSINTYNCKHSKYLTVGDQIRNVFISCQNLRDTASSVLRGSSQQVYK